MKAPNYKDTEGKHPIPHAKGLAKDEGKDTETEKKKEEKKSSKEEEE